MAKKTGIHAQHSFSDTFYEHLGLDKGTRADAVKAVWTFAKKHELNTSRPFTCKNGSKRNMACIKTCPQLREIFGKKAFLFMGDIASGIGEHIVSEG